MDLEHSIGAHWMRFSRGEKGTKVLTPIEVLPTPVTKSQSELSSAEHRHDLTHLPFWSWCLSCVTGRGLGPSENRVQLHVPRELRALAKSWTDYVQHGRPRARESQTMADAPCVKTATELLVRSVLDIFGRMGKIRGEGALAG